MKMQMAINLSISMKMMKAVRVVLLAVLWVA